MDIASSLGAGPASAGSSSAAADATFDGTWPFAARYTSAPGFRMHYVDEGQGPETLLMLHGEPTWGYLFRHLIAGLAPRHRVIAVDHMGFGKSEAPPARCYLLQDHIDNLESFVLGLNLRDLTLVMHDFGGPAGMGLAVRQPDRVRRIVSINAPTPLGQPNLSEVVAANAADAPWFRWVLRAQRDGVLDHVLGQLDVTMLSVLKLNGFERNEIVTDGWLRAYSHPFPDPAACAGPIGWARGFAEGAHRFERPSAATASALASKPAMAIWGMADRTLQARHFLPLFEAAFPGAPVHRLHGVGHYSPEDAPDAIGRLLATFLRPS